MRDTEPQIELSPRLKESINNIAKEMAAERRKELVSSLVALALTLSIPIGIFLIGAALLTAVVTATYYGIVWAFGL